MTLAEEYVVPPFSILDTTSARWRARRAWWLDADILNDAAVALKRGRYAAVVVSEVRDKTGRYRGLVPDTIEAMSDASLSYYNDVVISQPVGSLAVRASRQFSAFRKIGRRHQNLIVGLKGDAEHGWSAEREWTPDPQVELPWSAL